MYIYGGIYSDLTQSYKVRLSELVDHEHDELVLVEDRPIAPFLEGGVQISFIAARPKLDIFKQSIDGLVNKIKNRYYGLNQLHISGPYHFKEYLNGWKGNYRCELIQAENNTIVFKNDPSRIAIKTKHSKHDVVLQRHDKNIYYADLWDQRTVYYE